MKVYLFISNHKKLLKMYLPYIEALNKQLDITNSLVDADIVLVIGAWTWQGAQIAKKAKQMDIPYIVCPLGDISERNCKNPYLKRSLQQSMYQKAMYAKANLIVATTPMEKNYLEKKGWNKRIALIRYAGYSHLTNTEAIAAQTKQAIIAQIMQIKSRMPHQNIPQKYLDDLHTLLYADDYDEDAIKQELAEKKLSSYAASVFQTMTDKTGLTEGFMPIPAKKGRKSKEILKFVK